jgi:hypothetical protein
MFLQIIFKLEFLGGIWYTYFLSSVSVYMVNRRKSYALIIVLFNETFLCIISTVTHSESVKFFKYDLRDLYSHHVCKCLLVKYFRQNM